MIRSKILPLKLYGTKCAALARGGKHMTPEGVALALNECGPVCSGARDGNGYGGGGGAGGDDRARRQYAEVVVRRIIADGKELRERQEQVDDDNDEWLV